MKTVTNRDARALIARREEFKTRTGNFTGETHVPGNHVFETGYLPQAYAEHGRLNDADYIVYSYSTPIAWHLADGWVIPDVSYSMTTSSRHMPNLPFSEPMSASHLPSPWWMGLSKTAGDILRGLRLGHYVDVSGRAKRTVDAVLATGEAEWHDDESLAHVQRKPVVR